MGPDHDGEWYRPKFRPPARTTDLDGFHRGQLGDLAALPFLERLLGRQAGKGIRRLDGMPVFDNQDVARSAGAGRVDDDAPRHVTGLDQRPKAGGEEDHRVLYDLICCCLRS